MAEFTLPGNSKVKPGKTFKAPDSVKCKKTFSVYRWDPEEMDDQGTPKNPRLDKYEVDMDACGPIGLDADLPPLLPRGHLRLLLDEYRRHQHARLYQAD